MSERALKSYLPYTDSKGNEISIAKRSQIPTRYLKTALSKESQFEKPYLGPGYRQMHLAPPLTVSAPPFQVLPFSVPGLPPWKFSPWTPWPPFPKVEFKRPVPTTPWTPPGKGATKWLRYTGYGSPGICWGSIIRDCVAPGETFEIDVWNALGTDENISLNMTSQGDDIVTLGGQTSVDVYGNATGQGTMGDEPGIAVICSTITTEYTAKFSFEYQATMTLIHTRAGGILLQGPLRGPNLPYWRNLKKQMAKATIDCGCMDVENCDVDECVVCNYTVDEGTTPQTIGANDNVTVTFVPAEDCLESSTFSWSIEYPAGDPDQYGTGFSVDNASTGTPSVGVTTVGGDGTGFIVMEDECGNTAKYELRCTAGKWWLCAPNFTGLCTDSEYCDPLDTLEVSIVLVETGATGENHWSQVYTECRNCPYPECRAGTEGCDSRTCNAPWFSAEISCGCDYLLRKLWYWGR